MSFIKKYHARTQFFSEKVYNKADYDDTYTLVKVVLKIIGIRLFCKDLPAVRFLYNVFLYIELLSLNLALGLETAYVIMTAQAVSVSDTVTIFSTVPCMIYMILTVLKTYKLVSCRPKCENIINELRSMWPEGNVDNDEHFIISNALKELHFIIKGYVGSNLLLSLSYFVGCYIDIVKRAFGYDIPRGLPFNFWLWFDERQPIIFECILLMQHWQCKHSKPWLISVISSIQLPNISICGMLGGDLLFCILSSHICSQLDLLSLRIKKLIRVQVDGQLIPEFPLAQLNTSSISDKNKNRINDETDEKEYKELVDIVKRHDVLIRLADDIEELFSFILFINFLCVTLNICFCGFYGVLIEKWNEFNYKLFLVTGLAQSGLICWFGQKLLNASAGVADAIYSSGWYAASKRVKSTILIMLQRSQKEIRVTTYGFSTICLVSYATIIKSSFSYFTFLINIYS